MQAACVTALAAVRSAGEYLGPPALRIVTGKPDNAVEEVLSDAVREALRRLIRMSNLTDREAS